MLQLPRVMRYSFTSLVAPFLFAAFAVGCASSPTSATGPAAGGGVAALTADQIAGRWSLLSIQPASQTEEKVPAGASYDLTLVDDRASARADCNICSGSLVVDGPSLSIGPALACTRAACPTMAFENAYVSILAGESAAAIDGSSLTLTSPRGVLRFRR